MEERGSAGVRARKAPRQAGGPREGLGDALGWSRSPAGTGTGKSRALGCAGWAGWLYPPFLYIPSEAKKSTAQIVAL